MLPFAWMAAPGHAQARSDPADQGPECAAIVSLQRLIGQARALGNEAGDTERQRTIADIRITMANLQAQDFKSALAAERLRPHAGEIAGFLARVALSVSQSGATIPGAELARLTRLLSEVTCEPPEAPDNDQQDDQDDKPLPKVARELKPAGDRLGTPARLRVSLVEMRQEVTFGAAVVLVILGGIAAARLSQRATRRAVRYPCLIETNAMLNARACAATVHDLSQKGAKVSLNFDDEDGQMPELKTVIILFLGDRWVQGQVVWCNRHFLGALFDSPLRENALRHVLARSNPGGAQRGAQDPLPQKEGKAA